MCEDNKKERESLTVDSMGYRKAESLGKKKLEGRLRKVGET